MVFCPACGSSNPDLATSCSSCGAELAGIEGQAQGTGAAPAPPPEASGTPARQGRPAMARTMLGMAGLSPPPAAKVGQFDTRTPARTLLGMAAAGELSSKPGQQLPGSGEPHAEGQVEAPGAQGSASGEPAAAVFAAAAKMPDGSARNVAGRTMLGMAASDLMSGSHSTGQNPANKPVGKTMLGMAGLVPAPSAEPGSPHAPSGASGFETVSPGTMALDAAAGGTPPPKDARRPGAAEDHRTLLGVAMPGIAPLRPGEEKTARPAPSPVPDLGAAVVPEPADAPLSPAELELVGTKPPTPGRRLAWIFAAASLALLLIVAAALYLWTRTHHLGVVLAVDTSGKELLEVTCPDCPDHSTVECDGERATFSGGRAKLAPRQALSIGDNRLTLTLRRAGSNRVDQVEVSVPVDYRVRGDVSKLSDTPPVVRILVDARPDTRVKVEGRPVSLDSHGHGVVKLDATQDLLGQSASVKPYDRQVKYLVSLPSGETDGQVTIRVPITPLEIQSPGTSLITEKPTFTLSGRTAKGASLVANGHVLSVGSDGGVQQEMALSTTGATRLRLRALLPDHAPRFVDIELERVTSLKSRAKQLLTTSKKTFDEVFDSASKAGDGMIALTGSVLEVAHQGPMTTLLVDVPCAKGPCLLRATDFGHLSPKRGAQVTVFGRSPKPGSAAGASRLLEIHASFVTAG